MENVGCTTLSATVASRATAMERKAIGIISCVHNNWTTRQESFYDSNGVMYSRKTGGGKPNKTWGTPY